MPTKTYYLIAGEKSGDLHGGELIHALKECCPDCEFKGVGGASMQDQGLKPLAPFEDFQIMGFTDVIFALPRIIRHFYSLAHHILHENPEKVVFIDYQEFNIRLAKHLRKKGYKGQLIHYIAPSVWAWRKNRIQAMSQVLDLLLTIYPFEPHYFEKTGLKTLYVGNPLMQGLPELSPSEKKPILALFPGSRFNEITRNLPLQIQAAEIFFKNNPHWTIAISISHSQFEEPIQAYLKGVSFPYTLILESERYQLMQNAGLALAKSGTVTLELALRGCPTVVIYQLTSLNFFLAKYIFKISLPHYALPNILLNDSFFPEFYKTSINPKELALSLMSEAEKYPDIQKKAIALRALLSEKNASTEAAKEINQLC